MSRKRFDHMACPIALGLDEIGDWWSLLIVREAVMGVRRFVDFQAALGISKNILSQRLGRLVDVGVLRRSEAGVYGARSEYELTDKGRDLFVTLTAIRQWADRWIYRDKNSPAVVKDKRRRRPIARLRVNDADGRALSLDDVYVEVRQARRN